MSTRFATRVVRPELPQSSKPVRPRRWRWLAMVVVLVVLVVAALYHSGHKAQVVSASPVSLSVRLVDATHALASDDPTLGTVQNPGVVSRGDELSFYLTLINVSGNTLIGVYRDELPAGLIGIDPPGQVVAQTVEAQTTGSGPVIGSVEVRVASTAHGTITNKICYTANGGIKACASVSVRVEAGAG